MAGLGAPVAAPPVPAVLPGPPVVAGTPPGAVPAGAPVPAGVPDGLPVPAGLPYGAPVPAGVPAGAPVAAGAPATAPVAPAAPLLQQAGTGQGVATNPGPELTAGPVVLPGPPPVPTPPSPAPVAHPMLVRLRSLSRLVVTTEQGLRHIGLSSQPGNRRSRGQGQPIFLLPKPLPVRLSVTNFGSAELALCVGETQADAAMADILNLHCWDRPTELNACKGDGC